ncbi:porin [Cupriavidus necator]|uniref:porin n=1 Tax=Cupriavidus necator TaxID=106590 RepID=UPI00339D993A
MYKKIYTGALLAFAAQMAAAQSSVTLYGVADIGFEYLTHANANGNGLSRMTSGNVSGSRWGLRGVEDLGSGNKAIYAVESGFELDTGVSAQGGRLFGRQAFVGLQNQWGSLTLGRQNNVFYDILINYDPMVIAARYSSLMMDPTFAGRYDNTAKYTGKFGPVSAIALYSFARGTSISGASGTTFGTEVPGDAKSDRAFSGGLEYAGGAFGATVIYDQQQGTRGISGQNSNQRDRRAAVAGNVKFGNSTILAGYRWFNGDIGVAAGAPGRRNDIYWLGYRLQATPALGLTLAGYYFDDKRSDADPWSAVLSGNYVLSKRTDAFLTVGYVKNRNNSNLGLNGFGSTIGPGQNQTGVTLSVRHKF